MFWPLLVTAQHKGGPDQRSYENKSRANALLGCPEAHSAGGKALPKSLSSSDPSRKSQIVDSEKHAIRALGSPGTDTASSVPASPRVFLNPPEHPEKEQCFQWVKHPTHETCKRAADIPVNKSHLYPAFSSASTVSGPGSVHSERGLCCERQ